MKYPKQLMSISELVEMGYSRADLKQATKHPNAHKFVITTKGRGKYLFDTEAWEKCRKTILGRD